MISALLCVSASYLHIRSKRLQQKAKGQVRNIMDDIWYFYKQEPKKYDHGYSEHQNSESFQHGVSIDARQSYPSRR